MWVDAVVAHEMAHVVQFTLPRQRPATTYEGLGKYEGSHGSFFQAIYRIMRVQFINNRVTGVGRLRERTEFQRTEEQVQVIVSRKRTDRFELEGRTVRLGGLALTLVEFDLKARKYQYIGVTAAGKRYKLSRMQVLVGLQSEGVAKLAA
jgi:DNA-binding PadR family transcriptional regulator